MQVALAGAAAGGPEARKEQESLNGVHTVQLVPGCLRARWTWLARQQGGRLMELGLRGEAGRAALEALVYAAKDATADQLWPEAKLLPQG